ncbi:hypothetical protein KIL84_007705 [Mauremys mutica]|uniref:Uncharacterized protein n=1 Tax=Mauremys mutica TaxID=74926 RepID=A0A9D3X1T4_9SAUR|nr:hypothetical protein KIL84_007705 [Mauremys mutica]
MLPGRRGALRGGVGEQKEGSMTLLAQPVHLNPHALHSYASAPQPMDNPSLQLQFHQCTPNHPTALPSALQQSNSNSIPGKEDFREVGSLLAGGRLGHSSGEAARLQERMH